VRERRAPRIEVQRADLARAALGGLLDIDAAVGAREGKRQLAVLVDEEREEELLLELELLLDQHGADRAARDGAPEQELRLARSRAGVDREADAAFLGPAIRRDEGFDDDRASEPPGRGLRRRRRVGLLPARNGDAPLPQNLLRVVLENAPHAITTASGRNDAARS
jgi:hypothetical protein